MQRTELMLTTLTSHQIQTTWEQMTNYLACHGDHCLWGTLCLKGEPKNVTPDEVQRVKRTMAIMKSRSRSTKTEMVIMKSRRITRMESKDITTTPVVAVAAFMEVVLADPDALSSDVSFEFRFSTIGVPSWHGSSTDTSDSPLYHTVYMIWWHFGDTLLQAASLGFFVGREESQFLGARLLWDSVRHYGAYERVFSMDYFTISKQ